jgi:hypothetical protein
VAEDSKVNNNDLDFDIQEVEQIIAPSLADDTTTSDDPVLEEDLEGKDEVDEKNEDMAAGSRPTRRMCETCPCNS